MSLARLDRTRRGATVELLDGIAAEKLEQANHRQVPKDVRGSDGGGLAGSRDINKRDKRGRKRSELVGR